MSDVLKLLGSEFTLDSSGANTTISTVEGAVLVRLFNTSNDTNIIITQQTSANASIGTFTLGYSGTGADLVFIRKEASDKLTSSANSLVKAVAVGYY